MRFTALLLGVLLPASAQAFAFKTDPAGEAVRFEGPRVVFHAPAKVPGQLEASDVGEALQAALASWSEVSGLVLKTAPGAKDATIGFNREGSNTNDVLFVEDEWAWDDNALAVTIITVDQVKHVILDADIALNAAQRRFKKLSRDSAPGGVYDDLQNALTHELGHALGLAHSQLKEAAMWGGSLRGETCKRALSEDDVDGIRALYLKHPVALEAALPATGCSSTAGAPLDPMVALGLLLGLRRRRLVALVGAALSLPGLARASRPAFVAIARVEQSQPAVEHGLVVTRLVLRTVACERGACPVVTEARRFGGRAEGLEQRVDGALPPEVGRRVRVVSEESGTSLQVLD